MITLNAKAEVKAVMKKSTRAGFKDVQVGDVYEFTCPMEGPGTGCHGTYASYITMVNTRTGEQGRYSFNQMTQIYNIVKFEEIKEDNKQTVNDVTVSKENKKVKITTVHNRDLLEAPQGYYLAHCISSDFTLGAGVAEQIDEMFNMRVKLNDIYSVHCWEGKGECFDVDNVFNLVTKEWYYSKPTYEALREALVDMRTLMEFGHIDKVAMPKIGCGLDKMDWDEVYKIIEEVFYDMECEIMICVLD